jgi:hypothetical protein
MKVGKTQVGDAFELRVNSVKPASLYLLITGREEPSITDSRWELAIVLLVSSTIFGRSGTSWRSFSAGVCRQPHKDARTAGSGRSAISCSTMISPLSPSPYFTETAMHENADIVLGLNDGDTHLRSIAAVTGYHIHASDGQIGHIENFLIDDASWGIRYLIIDMKNWWPGKHVLMSPYAVREISCPKHQVRLDVSSEQVKSSLPWNPLDMIDRGYEKRLHGLEQADNLALAAAVTDSSTAAYWATGSGC